jgi:hypothetical protein
MCQYSAVDGFANDWHLVHGSRAIGGGIDYSSNGSFARRTYLARRPRSIDEQIEKLQQINNSSAVKTQFRYTTCMRVAKQVFRLLGMAIKN